MYGLAFGLRGFGFGVYSTVWGCGLFDKLFSELLQSEEFKVAV